MNVKVPPELEKPASVKVIGWLFIVVAGLMILSGAMGYIAYISMKKMGGDIPPVTPDMPGSFQRMAAVFQHIGLLIAVQVALGVVVIFAGIYFLKLRPWARTALEVFSWLGLVYVIGFGIFALVSWVGMSSKMLIESSAQGAPPMFDIMGIIIGVVAIGAWAVPIIVIIKFLRGPKIRDVFKQKR